jgi:hypothetical protein
MGKGRRVPSMALAMGVSMFLLSVVASAAPSQGDPAQILAATVASTPRDEPGRPAFVDRVSSKGQGARGLYFTYPYLRRFKPSGIIGLLKRSRMDAAVIDLKDDQGRISYQTAVEPLGPQIVKSPIDMRAAVRELRDAGVYTIARIVCFNDPSLPKREPDRAILDGRPKYAGKQQPWVSWGTGDTWLNPYDRRNHDMYVQMAKEAESFGFDEVQLDYIRFPVDKGTEFALYQPQTDELRRFVLLDMLRRIDAEIAIPLGVDVFGLAAIRNGDPTGLGQSLGDWTSHVEVFSPMLYVNAMPGWRTDVADRGHVLVKGPSYILRKRLGDGPVIRPFMQAFDNGLSASWAPKFIVEEITGARGGEADGFLFWNPGANYGMVQRGVAELAFGLMPFPAASRAAFREQVWARGEHQLSPDSARDPKFGW